MADEKAPPSEDEAEAMMRSIKTPDPKKDPAKDIEEKGAPDGIEFA